MTFEYAKISQRRSKAYLKPLKQLMKQKNNEDH